MSCLSPGADARLVRTVGYDELRDIADLIVVATPNAVREIAELDPISGFLPGDIKSGVETTFKILTVLKGDAAIREFTLHHLSYDSFTRPIANGPSIVSFAPKQHKTFLLFLRRASDGRYVAAAGELDPDISIREIRDFYSAP